MIDSLPLLYLTVMREKCISEVLNATISFVMRIAIQGDAGSFHDEAAKLWTNNDVEIVPASSFPETFKAVENNQAEALIVAIENSLYGGINQVYDLIEEYGYPIIGEIHLPIHHQLISKGTADTITDIYSHPVALAQCETYLDTHFPHAERHEYHDTAAAVAHIKQLNNPATAAIASEVAAHMHTMPIVASNIEDNPANFTRFLVLQPDGAAPKDANRTSLVLTTGNTPGSLAQFLTIFAAKNINLSKLQSRPIVGTPWKYRFYLVVDVAGSELAAALDEISPLTSSLTVLGQYRHSL